jgi:phosphoglycolate phosphatase-like HAD superfamily hydrolase
LEPESTNDRKRETEIFMHVLLFDIDGTLLNSGGAGQAAMEAAMRVEFGAARPVDGLRTAGRTDRAIAVDLFRIHGVALDDEALSRFYRTYLAQLPLHLTERGGMVLPGVSPLLEALRRREDVLLGLLTGNYKEGARLKLGHHGLHEHFEFGGFGDRHLDRDDVAREALAEVHRRFNGSFDAERLWVIGDTPADVRCARAIGARVVAVATGQYKVDELRNAAPDLLFDDLADTEAFVSILD